jgi:hypothetical protein
MAYLVDTEKMSPSLSDEIFDPAKLPCATRAEAKGEGADPALDNVRKLKLLPGMQ